MNTNLIKFDNTTIETSKGEGQLSTLTHDMKIVAEPFESDNPKAPTHRVFGFSPAGHKLEIGGIWKKKSGEGNDYFTLSIKQIKLNANLGRFPYQEDESLQAIIPWEDRIAA